MYNPIQLTIPEAAPLYNIENLVKIGINVNESVEEPTMDQFYSEAVFANGRQTLAPIIPYIEKIKEELNSKIAEHEKDPSKKFDPKEYWKSLHFKDFEDSLQKVFGLRSVQIYPWIEKYDSKEKVFESKECNCVVFTIDRFPIDGLVTDNGFYDKTHSVLSDIRISLGLIKALSAEEILAVLLHEFGHNIDPAIVDIKYAEANILSKYMTDRKKAINNNEKKAMKKFGKDNKMAFTSCMLNSLQWTFNKFVDYFNPKTKSSLLGDIFMSKSKKEEKRINKIREMVRSEKEEFNRQNFSEAFADNFARMYGYGPQLMSALRKLSKNVESQVNSRYKKEKLRQQIIFYITENALKDVHKTDVHRARALIKEYEADLKDPNIPDEVKKSIREDKEELEKILNEYLNNFGDLQNRINNAINDELKQINGLTASPVTESVEEYEEFTESKKGREKLQKALDAVTDDERKTFHKIFDPKLGKKVGCSLAKDKDGYFVTTHRARSKSYLTVDGIPFKDVKFVDSTC